MAGDEDPPTFTSDEAAIAHYRSRCTALQAQLAAAEQDILEFTESSKELQAELEGELERMDKAEKGMRRELEDARNEKEEWKGKYTTALKDHTTTITHMQRELETLRATEKELRTRVRDMELDNDDLEKSEREKDSSLQSLETRYNKALERIALLEEELVAKAQLEEEVQRLKDEVRDVNEELLVSRSQVEAAEKAATAAAAATVPTLATRPTSSSPSPPEVPAPRPAATAADAVTDAGSTLQRRTPSPESSPPSPSSSPQQPFVDPTPLPARIRRTSLIPSPPTSISPSKVSRSLTMRAEPFPSPPPPTGQTPFRAPLGRSTRTAHLQTYGLGRSPSSPALMASPSNRPHRGGGTQGGGDLPRTDTATMIRDMQQMTSRVRMLTQRLDQRRSSVMRGSAIPRFGSPATTTATGSGTGDESPTSRGSGSDYPPPPPRTMSRSSTLRTSGLNGNGTMGPPLALGSSRPPVRPPSRLGERDSTRPPSRSAVLRASIASSMAAKERESSTSTSAAATGTSASSSRPSSRLSIASSTATTSSLPMTTRPLTPSNIGGPRSATPTNGYYPPATTSRAGSTAHPHPPRPSSSLGRSSLSKSVAAAAAGSTHASYGHARHASTALAASSMSTTLRSGRATPHQDESAAHDEDDRRRQLRSTMRRTSMGGTGGGANRRTSGIGLGLASSGNSSSAPLSKSLGGGGGGRRASLAASYGANGGREGLHGGDHHHHHHRRTATRDEVPPVPPLPGASR
ncbi:hypothetical protein C6P46_005640 [Rhodotorula mucilaginosa]|uniref:NUDE domain-containing protein n=1 Tax=Rhodotorula mucilaginosa TaxID=5537 RepID=A0A9P6W0E7_RHOMI|nr:hypothetical protein C6P46_005640 [Rhodotorula mucilaginosa]